MDDFNAAEYVVTQKKEGKNLLLRRLLMLGYVVFALAYIVVFISIKLIPVIAILPLLMWIIIHFTWRYVNVEHKYVIEHGDIIFSECYSSGDDNVIIKQKIADAAYIGRPGDREERELLPFRLKDLRGSVNAENAAVMIYEENGKRYGVYFVTSKKAESLINLYNKNTKL